VITQAGNEYVQTAAVEKVVISPEFEQYLTAFQDLIALLAESFEQLRFAVSQGLFLPIHE